MEVDDWQLDDPASAAVRPYVNDPFIRTASDGWGLTPDGQAWTVVAGEPSAFSVDGQRAVVAVPAADNIPRGITLAGMQPCGRIELRCAFEWDSVPVGGSTRATVMGRFVDTSNYLWVQLILRPDNRVELWVGQLDGGASTTLAPMQVIFSEMDGGRLVELRLQFEASRIRVKWWLAGLPKPDAWGLVTEQPVTMAAAGVVGFSCRVSTAYTGALPVNVRVNEVRVVNPQRLAVIRAGNSILKAHEAGTAVRLWEPAVWAL